MGSRNEAGARNGNYQARGDLLRTDSREPGKVSGAGKGVRHFAGPVRLNPSPPPTPALPQSISSHDPDSNGNQRAEYLRRQASLIQAYCA